MRDETEWGRFYCVRRGVTCGKTYGAPQIAPLRYFQEHAAGTGKMLLTGNAVIRTGRQVRLFWTTQSVWYHRATAARGCVV